jgi:hypothetical protein
MVIPGSRGRACENSDGVVGRDASVRKMDGRDIEPSRLGEKGESTNGDERGWKDEDGKYTGPRAGRTHPEFVGSISSDRFRPIHFIGSSKNDWRASRAVSAEMTRDRVAGEHVMTLPPSGARHTIGPLRGNPGACLLENRRAGHRDRSCPDNGGARRISG